MKESWNRNKTKIFLTIIFTLLSYIVYNSNMFQISFPDRAICIEHQFNIIETIKDSEWKR